MAQLRLNPMAEGLRHSTGSGVTLSAIAPTMASRGPAVKTSADVPIMAAGAFPAPCWAVVKTPPPLIEMSSRASGPLLGLLRGLCVLALAALALFLATAVFDALFIHWLAGRFENGFRELWWVNPHAAKLIISLLIALGAPLYFRYDAWGPRWISRRLGGIFLWIGLASAVTHSFALAGSWKANFAAAGGVLRYYAIDPDNHVRWSTQPRINPTTGTPFLPVTPATARELALREHLSFSEITDPSSSVWFAPGTGEPLLWWTRRSDGLHFFNLPGYDPLSAQLLAPATPKLREEWLTDRENQRAAARTAADATAHAHATAVARQQASEQAIAQAQATAAAQRAEAEAQQARAEAQARTATETRLQAEAAARRAEARTAADAQAAKAATDRAQAAAETERQQAAAAEAARLQQQRGTPYRLKPGFDLNLDVPHHCLVTCDGPIEIIPRFLGFTRVIPPGTPFRIRPDTVRFRPLGEQASTLYLKQR
jgi:hypothetical protein